MSYAFDWSSIPGAIPALIDGAKVTFEVLLIALAVAIPFGALLAVMRLSSNKALSWFAAAYTNVFRSIPLVMVILWFYLIVPQLLRSVFGGDIENIGLVSAMTAFALFESAYYAEIFRAGIQSVPKGQMGAATALGMTNSQAMILIILPQAFRNMTPLLLTQAIVLFQDTSLVYIIGVMDFLKTAYAVGERDGRIVEMLIFAGAMYFIVSFALSQAVKQLQKRMGK
ncbi:glutamate/aspartate transport system permease protein [Chitinivorax tropicus]|uniref:Glutamate/aspartate import permease protein GltK n=1 Tax=Chitinivorax tropicus TaxID=714531 RepID=A0A840MF31_9PROT|nr:ABC transporter permease subunit [Chitinivorax tropicus]MBB5017288.1 glutamate/aspartate transport system permease protein [Chitinivorax tropicus]